MTVGVSAAYRGIEVGRRLAARRSRASAARSRGTRLRPVGVSELSQNLADELAGVGELDEAHSHRAVAGRPMRLHPLDVGAGVACDASAAQVEKSGRGERVDGLGCWQCMAPFGECVGLRASQPPPLMGAAAAVRAFAGRLGQVGGEPVVGLGELLGARVAVGDEVVAQREQLAREVWPVYVLD